MDIVADKLWNSYKVKERYVYLLHLHAGGNFFILLKVGFQNFFQLNKLVSFIVNNSDYMDC